MKKRILLFALFLFVPFLMAGHYEQGLLRTKPHVDQLGRRVWYAIPSGTGNCLSWDDACDVVTAVGKTTNGIWDTIYLGAGNHDVVSEGAGGLVITNDHIEFIGRNHFTHSCQIVNSHVAATNVVTTAATGDYIIFQDVAITSVGQPDVNVDLLYINGSSYITFETTYFAHDISATTGDGLVMENGASNIYFYNSWVYSAPENGIHIDGAVGVTIENMVGAFMTDSGAIVINSDNAANALVIIYEGNIIDSETGISITAGSNYKIVNPRLNNNTTNVVEGSGMFGEIIWADMEDFSPRQIYPTTSAGITISTGDGDWVWTASATTIIPVSTIDTSFVLNNFQLRSYDASQTYMVEFFYGESTPTISLGVFEFTVGATPAGRSESIVINIGQLLDANSIVGAKLRSNTAGIDNVEMTVGVSAL